MNDLKKPSRFDDMISNNHGGGTSSYSGETAAVVYSSKVDRPSASPLHSPRGRQPFCESYWMRMSDICNPNWANPAAIGKNCNFCALHASKELLPAAPHRKDHKFIRGYILNSDQSCSTAKDCVECQQISIEII